MSNQERPLASVQDSLIKAEGNVNHEKMDVNVPTKTKIFNAEGDVKRMIARYKQMGVYQDVQAQFDAKQAASTLSDNGVRNYEINVMKGNLEQKDSPELRLRDMAFQFDRYRNKVESETEGEMLQVLANSTASQLTELKTQLANAAGDAAEQEAKYQDAVQPFANVLYKPENISDTLKNLGEMLGQEPNIEKLTACEQENDVLFNELLKPENSRKMRSANEEFASLTGLRLDEVKDKVMEKLLAVRTDVAYMADKTRARGLFTAAYKDALTVMQTQNEVQTYTLFQRVDQAMEPALHEESEANGELTEEDMAMMLDLIVSGTEDPSFYEQVMNVKTAYESNLRGLSGLAERITGTNPLEWAQKNLAPEYQRAALWYFNASMKLQQGAVNVVPSTVAGAYHYFRHPMDSLSHLAHSVAVSVECRDKILKFAAYGWENTTLEQKSLLLAEITGNVVGSVATSAGVGAGLNALSKVPTVANVLTKLGAVTRKAGALSSAGMRLALATAEVSLQKFPQLVKYGAKAKDAVHGMVDWAQVLSHKYHLMHKLEHAGHTAVHRSEQAVHYTHLAEAATVGAFEKAAASNTPTYQQIDALSGDIRVATGNAEELGLTTQEIVQLQSSLKGLGALKLGAA